MILNQTGPIKQYFFELGANPALSTAEICAVLGLTENNFQMSGGKIMLIKTEKEIDARALISRLGGTIKIGEIAKDDLSIITLENIWKIIENIPKKSGKFTFGFSDYSQKRINLKPLAMETKKSLKEKNISCRWVTGKEAILSSVIVEQNGLTKNGVEIIILASGNKLSLGITRAVQPFKELSFRDYGRPARDDHSGMLPPKLAQILINLALGFGAEKIDSKKTLLDPFCGSGTIASEATLIGLNKIIASDISPKAIADTEKNLIWFFKKIPENISLLQLDAKLLSKKIPAGSIDAIASEPFLGPQRGGFDRKKIGLELSDFYSNILKEFYTILKPGACIAFILPVFKDRSGRSLYLNPDTGNLKLPPALQKIMLGNINGYAKNRNSFIYGRAGQKVWREILVLCK